MTIVLLVFVVAVSVLLQVDAQLVTNPCFNWASCLDPRQNRTTASNHCFLVTSSYAYPAPYHLRECCELGRWTSSLTHPPGHCDGVVQAMDITDPANFGYLSSQCDGNDPCSPGGECTRLFMGYVCKCKNGYFGKNCKLQSCSPDPCVAGTCTPNPNDPTKYTCQCPLNYRGIHCEIYDPCMSVDCGVHGVCKVNNNQASCLCSAGFSGSRCEIQACNPSPCQNGGRCSFTQHASDTTYTTSCACTQPGTSGLLCEIGGTIPAVLVGTAPPFLTPLQKQSLGAGYCSYSETCLNPLVNTTDYYNYCFISVNDNYPAITYPGECCGFGKYSSAGMPGSCDTSVVATSPTAICINNNPCQNGGVCAAFVGGYTCICPADGLHWGINCTQSACTYRTCHNGGTCVLTGRNESHCECATGYNGADCSAHDVCANANDCGQHGTCLSTDGVSRNCVCANGWRGPKCTISSCRNSPCKNSAECYIDQDGTTPKCACVAGTTGVTCEQGVLEPSQSAPPANLNSCHGYSSCLSTYYQENAVVQLSGLGPLKKSDYCFINKYASDVYSCCPIFRFTGPDKFCEYTALAAGAPNAPFLTNPCNSGPCQNGGTCTPYNGFYMCKCAAGYGGLNCADKIGCSDYTSCENLNQVTNSNHCFMNLFNQSDCCNFGYYSSNGGTCNTFVNLAVATTDPCASNPCQNAGTCQNWQGVSYTCQCAIGYFGHNCSLSHCTTNPCEHGGTCIVDQDSFRCACLPGSGYEGIFCETFNPCNLNPCPTHSTCQRMGAGVNDYVCLYDHCYDSPCLHGSSCISNVSNPVHGSNHSFTCDCTGGYYGDTCALNLCSPNPCAGNRTNCLISPSGKQVICACPVDTYGFNCEFHNITSVIAYNQDSSQPPITTLGISLICIASVSFLGGVGALSYLFYDRRKRMSEYSAVDSNE